MQGIRESLRLTVEALAGEIADRCSEHEVCGHAQIERHARNVLIDYFRGEFNPVAGWAEIFRGHCI